MGLGHQLYMVQAVNTPELAELLIEGARYGDLEDVKQALEQGAHIDCTDEQGRTGMGTASCAEAACTCSSRRTSDGSLSQACTWQVQMGHVKWSTCFYSLAL